MPSLRVILVFFVLVISLVQAEAGECNLTYITTIKVNGCPVHVHRAGDSEAGKFALEPVLCVIDRRIFIHNAKEKVIVDDKLQYSLSLLVTKSSVELEAKEQLMRMIGGTKTRSVKFMEVLSVKATVINPLHNMTFPIFWWMRGDDEGTLSLVMEKTMNDMYDAYRRDMEKGVFDWLDNFAMVAETRVSNCPPVTRLSAVAVADETLPIKMLRRSLPSSTCQLEFVRAFHLHNCKALLYQRKDMIGYFVLEPLMCYRNDVKSFINVNDKNGNRLHQSRFRLVTEDSQILHAVTAEIANLKPLSVSYMKLLDADIVLERDRKQKCQFSVEQLRLSADRSVAEVRAVTSEWSNLENVYRTVECLIHDSWPLWSQLLWNVTFGIPGACRVESKMNKFAFGRVPGSLQGEPSPLVINISYADIAEYQNHIQPYIHPCYRIKKIKVSNSSRFETKAVGATILHNRCKSNRFAFSNSAMETKFQFKNTTWIGLKNLHACTSVLKMGLRVEIMLVNGTHWYGEWENFTVGNYSDNYRMQIGRMKPEKSNINRDIMSSYNGSFFGSINGYNGWWLRTAGQVTNDGFNPSYCSLYIDVTSIPIKETKITLTPN